MRAKTSLLSCEPSCVVRFLRNESSPAVTARSLKRFERSSSRTFRRRSSVMVIVTRGGAAFHQGADTTAPSDLGHLFEISVWWRRIGVKKCGAVPAGAVCEGRQLELDAQ